MKKIVLILILFSVSFSSCVTSRPGGNADNNPTDTKQGTKKNENEYRVPTQQELDSIKRAKQNVIDESTYNEILLIYKHGEANRALDLINSINPESSFYEKVMELKPLVENRIIIDKASTELIKSKYKEKFDACKDYQEFLTTLNDLGFLEKEKYFGPTNDSESTLITKYKVLKGEYDATVESWISFNNEWRWRIQINLK